MVKDYLNTCQGGGWGGQGLSEHLPGRGVVKDYLNTCQGGGGQGLSEHLPGRGWSRTV